MQNYLDELESPFKNIYSDSTLDRAMTVAYNNTRDWMMRSFDLTEVLLCIVSHIHARMTAAKNATAEAAMTCHSGLHNCSGAIAVLAVFCKPMS